MQNEMGLECYVTYSDIVFQEHAFQYSQFSACLKNKLSDFGTLSRDGNMFNNHKVLVDEEAAVLRSATESTNLSISSPMENGNKESISETLRLDETDTMEKIRYE
jgi:hypothetical protein